MRNTQIVDKALEYLKSSISGLSVNFFPEDSRSKEKDLDGYLEISRDGNSDKLFVEIKNEIRQPNLADFIRRFGNDKRHWIVISNYIPSPMKYQLKELGINYLESSGNSFINAKNLFLFINDQKVTQNRLANDGKVWNASGLKFIFSILNNEKLLNESYRQIAKEAGIALGNIGPFMVELNKEGYLLRKNNTDWLLVNRDMLIKRWVELYHLVLKPKLLIGRFKFISSVNTSKWKSWPAQDFVWGGENAGSLLTNHLKPQDFTIYTRSTKINLMNSLKLAPSADGNVEMVEQFWPIEIQESLKVKNAVPPLVAYAELITSLDSRNRETAERIKL